MGELCESLKCLCNSPQRLRILGVLDDEQMDVRDLMAALDSPRSTVQRNLSVLEEQGWVETTGSRYTATTVGGLLYEKFVTMNEITATIERMTPFFAAVDTRPDIGIGQLTDALVTTPELNRPNAPMKRLFETFSSTDRVRGFMPVVSGLAVELFHKTNDSGTIDHEYVLSRNAFDTLRVQYGDGESGRTSSPRTEVSIYADDIPYGLFISDEQLALTAYDEVGRMQVVVESTSESAIEWGEEMYEIYRRQSTQPHEKGTTPVARDTEPVD